MHLTVIMDSPDTIQQPKIDTTPKVIFDPWVVPPTPIYPIKKQIISYCKISSNLDFGFFNVHNSNQNYILDTNMKNIHFVSFGAGVDLRQRYLYMNFGAQFATYIEEFSLNNKWQVIDTNLIRNIDITSIWDVDTIWYLNTDSLLIGDTVWMPYYDSTMINQYDTTFTQKYDTVYHSMNTEKINKIRYLEIPLIIGGHFRVKKMRFYIGSGLVVGIPINTNYNLALPYDAGIIKGTFSKMSYWSYSKINIEYSFNKRLFLRFGFFYKFPLNYQITVFDNKRKYFSYGINFGVALKL